jgi:hypothetical protein
MMAISEQIASAAREILNVFVHSKIAAKKNLHTLQIDE